MSFNSVFLQSGRLNRYLETGIRPENTEALNKKVRVVNLHTVLWVILLVLFSLIEISMGPDVFRNLPFHLFGIVAIALVYYCHHRGLYTQAHLLHLANLWCSVMIWAYWLEPGKNIQYFLILLPAVSLILFDSRLINYAVLTIAMLSFLIPQIITKGNHVFWDAPVAKQGIFISVFAIVNYFKILNQKAEKLLKQKVMELEDTRAFQQRFFANVAHEIKTPLSIILGNKQRIEQRLDTSDATINKAVHSIEREVNSIEQITSDVMLLSQLDDNTFELKQQPVNLSQLLLLLAESMRPLFEQKRIGFVFNQKDTMDYLVLGDPLMLERAFNNILSNSYKFTNPGGMVSLSIKSKPDQRLCIWIEDNGIGIDEKHHEMVFQRFYQVDNDINQAGGNGIGLAYVKEIVEQHKGQLTLNSQLGKGSLFSIELPLHDQAFFPGNGTNTLQKSDRQTAQSIDTNHRLLLVEDNAQLAGFLAESLIDYKPYMAKHGVEALEMIERNGFPDLIITDYMMPEMDGLGFINTLKQKYQPLQLPPIIILTAIDRSDIKLSFLRLGVDDFIGKPFDVEELRLKINNSIINHQNRTAFVHSLEKDGELPTDVSDHSWVKGIQAFVMQHCADPHFSLDLVCESFSISQSTLFRKTKSLTGLNPNGFVREVRLQKAYELIQLKKHITPKELTYSVGLKNTTRFLKQYEERFGKAALGPLKR